VSGVNTVEINSTSPKTPSLASSHAAVYDAIYDMIRVTTNGAQSMKFLRLLVVMAEVTGN